MLATCRAGPAVSSLARIVPAQISFADPYTLWKRLSSWRWRFPWNFEFASVEEEDCCGIVIPALKACASAMDLGCGGLIHAHSIRSGIDSNIYVATTLVDMYAKCGNMIEARRVFDAMEVRNTVAWTALILGYAENGLGELGLELFSRMRLPDCCCRPDSTTFLAALKACGDVAGREQGRKIRGKLVRVAGLAKVREIHAQVIGTGCDSHTFVANSLISLYAKCGGVEEACSVFEKIGKKTVVSWTAVILGCVENGEAELALDLFSRMESASSQEEMQLDARVFVAALTACSSVCQKEVGRRIGESCRVFKLECLERGTAIHSSAARRGFDSNTFVSNTLVDMYFKCGSSLDARAVFDRMRFRDIVSWNALLLGYAENGEPELALELFEAMKTSHRPNARTFVAALVSCGALASLQRGREIHDEIRERHCELLESDPFLGNSLIDFYGKCGSMKDAKLVFDWMIQKTEWKNDVVTWSALIAGYSHQGDTSSIFKLFDRMVNEKVEPDAVTFLSILTACSHAGLVDEGKHYFRRMTSQYGIAPTTEHYHCLVDLLGRANHLDEAVAVVKDMPFAPSAITWGTLLGACNKWKNTEVAKFAFESWLKLDKVNATAYLLMANTSSA